VLRISFPWLRLRRVLALDVVARQMREDVTVAMEAIERVGGQLDGFIAQADRAAAEQAADIYDKGKKCPPASSVEVKNFDVPVGATEVYVQLRPAQHGQHGAEVTEDLAQGIVLFSQRPSEKPLALACWSSIPESLRKNEDPRAKASGC